MNVKRKTVKIKSLTSENQKLLTENEGLQQKVEQADADIEEFIQDFENKNKKMSEENEILKSSRVQLLSLIQKQTIENRLNMNFVILIQYYKNFVTLKNLNPQKFSNP